MASRNAKKSVALTLSAAMLASVIAPMATADAGHRHHHHHSGAILGAGIIGLALGTIIAGSNDYRRHRAEIIYQEVPPPPPPQYIYHPQPYYSEPPQFIDRPYENPGYREPYPLPGKTYYEERGYRDTRYEQPKIHKKHRNKEPKVITYDEAMSKKTLAEPWTPEWYSYCRARFRSFNAKTGTFLGYDGKRHFCVPK